MSTEKIVKCDLCGIEHSSLEKRHWSDTIEKVELSFKDHAGLQCVPFSGDYMSQKKCKYCGNYYDYSVTSNGYSENYCKFSCESYARINELKKLVEEKENTTRQLKAEITGLASEHRAHTVDHPYKDNYIELIERLEQLSAV